MFVFKHPKFYRIPRDKTISPNQSTDRGGRASILQKKNTKTASERASKQGEGGPEGHKLVSERASKLTSGSRAGER